MPPAVIGAKPHFCDAPEHALGRIHVGRGQVEAVGGEVSKVMRFSGREENAGLVAFETAEETRLMPYACMHSVRRVSSTPQLACMMT
jgi:hypothetical protein